MPRSFTTPRSEGAAVYVLKNSQAFPQESLVAQLLERIRLGQCSNVGKFLAEKRINVLSMLLYKDLHMVQDFS